MSHLTQNTGGGKPRKPYRDYPLYAHATGRWAKRIRGKIHYFGPWSDPDAALKRYLDEKEDLYAGRTPRVLRDGLTVRDLANKYLTAKVRQREAGELRPKSFHDYHATCARLVGALGADRFVDDLTSDDFGKLRASLAKDRGPVALGNEIQRIRGVFKYGYEAGLIDKPLRFGPEFKKPSRRAVRIARSQQPVRMFTAQEVRRMLEAASPRMKAMILLAINAGLGNNDISELPIAALDLDNGFLNYPRPKTGVPRRCPLWPEVTAAVRGELARRKPPKKKADEGLLFINKFGERYVRDVGTDGVGQEFSKLLRELGIQRRGVRFYALRHVHRTVADEVGDKAACDTIMGHLDYNDMATHYRHGVSDERLRKVADHVHAWLWPPGQQPACGTEHAGAAGGS